MLEKHQHMVWEMNLLFSIAVQIGNKANYMRHKINTFSQIPWCCLHNYFRQASFASEMFWWWPGQETALLRFHLCSSGAISIIMHLIHAYIVKPCITNNTTCKLTTDVICITAEPSFSHYAWEPGPSSWLLLREWTADSGLSLYVKRLLTGSVIWYRNKFLSLTLS